MKTNRGHTLVGYLILTGLAICFSPAMLSAENWRVTFTLPFETHWGDAVLPAGDYSLLFDTVRPGMMRIQQGVYNIAMVGLWNKETPRPVEKSQLLIVRGNNEATVHILYIAKLGTAFHFRVPERYEVYTELIARADEPAIIQRLPVTVSGK